MLDQHHTDTLYAFFTHRRYRVWRHVLFIAMLVPIGLSQSFFALGGEHGVPVGTIYLFGACFSIVTLAIVYFNGYYLVPHLLPRGRYASYLVALVGVIFIFLVLKYTTEYVILLKAGFHRTFNEVALLDALSNGIIYAVCIVSPSVTLLLRQWNSDRTMIASLARKQLENSIDELKSRIHPVFLYATLDGAARMVRHDAKQASDMLFMLSELLNYQLYDATRDEVLLTAEIACIRRYLMLKQLNSEHPFSHTVTVEGDVHRLVDRKSTRPERRQATLVRHL